MTPGFWEYTKFSAKRATREYFAPLRFSRRRPLPLVRTPTAGSPAAESYEDQGKAYFEGEQPSWTGYVSPGEDLVAQRTSGDHLDE